MVDQITLGESIFGWALAIPGGEEPYSPNGDAVPIPSWDSNGLAVGAKSWDGATPLPVILDSAGLPGGSHPVAQSLLLTVGLPPLQSGLQPRPWPASALPNLAPPIPKIALSISIRSV